MNLKKQLTFFKKIDFLYKGGRPIAEIFDSLAKTEKGIFLKGVFRDISEEIKAGSSLTKALEVDDDLIDESYRRLIHIGEKSGRLDESLKHIISLISALIDMRRKVIGAMLYPCALIGVYFSVFVLIFFVVLPLLIEFMAKSGLKLPGYLTVIVGFKNLIFSSFGCCGIPIALVIIGLFVYIYLNLGILDYFRSRLLLFIPGFGRLDKLKNLYFYLFTLKICYDSGVTNVEATELAALNVSNHYILDKLAVVNELVKNGRSIHDALQASGQIDFELIDIVRVGEEAGKLHDSYEEVIRILDDRIKMTIIIMVGLVKPLGIVFGILMLAGIFLSIGLILFGVLSSVKSMLPG